MKRYFCREFLSGSATGSAMIIGLLMLLLATTLTLVFLSIASVESVNVQRRSDHARSLYATEAGMTESFHRLNFPRYLQSETGEGMIYPYIPMFTVTDDRGTVFPADDIYWHNDTIDNNGNGLVDEWGELDPAWTANIWYTSSGQLPAVPSSTPGRKYNYYATTLDIGPGTTGEVLHYSDTDMENFSLRMSYKKFPNGNIVFLDEHGREFEQPATNDLLGTPVVVIESSGKWSTMRRHVKLEAYPMIRSIFETGLCGCEEVQIKGHSSTDSYNSLLGSYAQTQGSHGNVGSNGNIDFVGSPTIGGSTDAGTDIDGGSATITYDAEAGGTVTGGTINGEVTQNLDPAPIPCPCNEIPVDVEMDYFELYNDNSSIGLTDQGRDPFKGSPYNLELTGTDNLTLQAGTYYFDSIMLKAQATISINGKVTIYLRNDGDLRGGGLVNSSQIPSNLSIYSMGEEINIGGNTSFYGTIYAPYADIHDHGTTDTYGSLLGNTITKVGTSAFHYDEALNGNARKFFSSLRKLSWEEI